MRLSRQACRSRAWWLSGATAATCPACRAMLGTRSSVRAGVRVGCGPAVELGFDRARVAVHPRGLRMALQQPQEPVEGRHLEPVSVAQPGDARREGLIPAVERRGSRREPPAVAGDLVQHPLGAVFQTPVVERRADLPPGCPRGRADRLGSWRRRGLGRRLRPLRSELQAAAHACPARAGVPRARFPQQPKKFFASWYLVMSPTKGRAPAHSMTPSGPRSRACCSRLKSRSRSTQARSIAAALAW